MKRMTYVTKTKNENKAPTLCIVNSQFTIHNSQFTIHNSLFTNH